MLNQEEMQHSGSSNHEHLLMRSSRHGQEAQLTTSDPLFGEIRPHG
jgi:hypothetical protein